MSPSPAFAAPTGCYTWKVSNWAYARCTGGTGSWAAWALCDPWIPFLSNWYAVGDWTRFGASAASCGSIGHTLIDHGIYTRDY